MQTQELLSYLNVPFSFSEQPVPLQPQLRVIWGLSTIVLILQTCSRSNRSSISRLHLLNWSLRNNKNRERMVELLENNRSPIAVFIKYDPGFNRAIEYAIAESLVEFKGKGRIVLLSEGRQLAKEIIAAEDCLVEEKRFLNKKGALINEGFIKTILRTS